MRTLLLVLAVGLFVLVATPQNALACEIFVSSSEDGWFQSESSGPQSMVDEGSWGEIATASPGYKALPGFTAVTPSGHFIGLNTFGLGVNLFGSDCLVAGQIVAVQAPAP